MSTHTAYTIDGPFDVYAQEGAYTKTDLDQSLSFMNSMEDVVAPTTDEFDSDLDALFEGINFDALTVQTTNPRAFQFHGSDSFSLRGPASAFTFSSSESSYESHSTHSESSYGHSSRDAASDYSLSFDLDSEYQRFSVDTQAQSQGLTLGRLDCIDPTAFNTMPASPYNPSDLALIATKSYDSKSSFSDYGPSTANFLNQLASYGTIAGATVSVDQIDSHLSGVYSIALAPSSTDDSRKDNSSKKKYKCTVCTRAFDRAYNLKTHMDTHNPNRQKPYVCPHLSCHRAFSRKHDLGRHIISLHRENAGLTPVAKTIGVGNGAHRCHNCGKGSVGNGTPCDCDESDQVK
ncbi:hypothetical protein F5877DRAFT_79437 [Lentinula edodes]|nr:hypothetical protein F5877DRAFT_79437 [Lentinula edodes]